MKNNSLVKDYLMRAQSRYKALDVYVGDENWADVVRESQEACELILKAVLRYSNIDPPRTHDVSIVLEENEKLLPKEIQKNLKEVCKISKTLRRDRELAFYGSDDLTPSEFYQKDDAMEARAWVKYLIDLTAGLKE